MIDLFGTQRAQLEAENEGFKRGVAAKVDAAKSENQIYAVLTPADAPEFLDACADLAKLGMSADQLRQIAHAAKHNRILAFTWGQINDIGEAGRPHDGSTRGTNAYAGG